MFVPGKGLTLVGSVIQGSLSNNKDKVELAKLNINEMMKKEKTKGFSDVIACKDVAEGLSYMQVFYSDRINLLECSCPLCLP